MDSDLRKPGNPAALYRACRYAAHVILNVVFEYFNSVGA